MTRLVVCRHADPTAPGGAQAVAQALRPVPLAALYTSPLARARETAAAIGQARGLTATVLEDLREIDLGEVDGLGFEDYPTELQDALLRAPARARFPGGESYPELRDRVVECVRRIVGRHSDAAVGVVTHAGPIRALLGTWLQMADDAVFRLDQRYGAVNVVDLTDGVPFVRLVNGNPAMAPLG